MPFRCTSFPEYVVVLTLPTLSLLILTHFYGIVSNLKTFMVYHNEHCVCSRLWRSAERLLVLPGMSWSWFRPWISSGLLDIPMFLEWISSFKGYLSNGRCMVEASIQSNLLPLHKSEPSIRVGKHVLQMQYNQGHIAERGRDYLRALIQSTKNGICTNFPGRFFATATNPLPPNCIY